MEADHMSGVWSRVLGNTTPPEYQTVRSDIKGALYILRTEERNKLMEIKYTDNIDIMDVSICDIPEVREELKRRIKNEQ